MGTFTTIYGCIFFYVTSDRTDQSRANAGMIHSLPKDDRYPQLTRNMFAVTATDYPQPGFYKYQMVHFGASLKDDGEDWDLWLKKFERLLRRMHWNKVELRLEIEAPPEGCEERRFDFTWKRTAGPEPGNEWELRGGPRFFGKARPRAVDWVPCAEEELRLRPDDTSLMVRLVYAYQRADMDDKARSLFERLETLAPEKAALVDWI